MATINLCGRFIGLRSCHDSNDSHDRLSSLYCVWRINGFFFKCLGLNVFGSYSIYDPDFIFIFLIKFIREN